ncbi:MAG: hypothetical protein B6247_00010 [Candidatus Parabeggiatoa sp. nov. 2]|nr:MAG: hypothetical protein B6247_00010 [Beggiatoa sp. 4572_84]
MAGVQTLVWQESKIYRIIKKIELRAINKIKTFHFKTWPTFIILLNEHVFSCAQTPKDYYN